VLARYLVAQAVKKLPKAWPLMHPTEPVRGARLLELCHALTVVAFAAMQSALGTDFDLSNYPGWLGPGCSASRRRAPRVNLSNFAMPAKIPATNPTLFWLARRYHHPCSRSWPGKRRPNDLRRRPDLYTRKHLRDLKSGRST